MTPVFLPDGETPSQRIDLDTVLHRLRVLEQNQRDILFLLRSLRHALRSEWLKLSAETKRVHREVIRLAPYAGRCPCCLDTRVVDDQGQVIPPAEYDHFWGGAYNAPIHSWLICRPCHLELSNDRHLAWYHHLQMRFRAYQAAVAAYAQLSGHRTPARIHVGTLRP
ncbi:MAG TPA: hypothetical protein VE690_01980 [Rhodopila sp.]|jgi:hypothetical protein|nr:hypothetical protein [Rhodopila sp.]